MKKEKAMERIRKLFDALMKEENYQRAEQIQQEIDDLMAKYNIESFDEILI